MINFYVICMNPSCRFSAVGYVSDFKFCPDCGGQEILDACPYCKKEDTSVYFIKKNQIFCQSCGKRIKPEPVIKIKEKKKK